MEWVKLIIGGILILLGVVVACIAVAGVYKFKFVLNRMHAAATNDTLGILLVFLGLIFLNGFNFTSLKLFLVVCFFWLASPVSGHMLARLEIATDKEKVKEECEVPKDVDI